MISYTDARLAFETRDPATANLCGRRAILKGFAHGLPEGAALQKVSTRAGLATLAEAHRIKWEPR